MTDIDTDPFEEHESRPDDHTDTGEIIPLIPGGPKGGSTWEPTCEQETSFGGESQRTRLMKGYIKDLYKKYQRTLVNPQKNFTMIILNSKMGNYTTEARESP